MGVVMQHFLSFHRRRLFPRLIYRGDWRFAREKEGKFQRKNKTEGLSHVQFWLVPNTIASLEWFAPVLTLLDHGEACFGRHEGGKANTG